MTIPQASRTWDFSEKQAVVDLVREKEARRQMLNVACLSAVRSVFESVQSLQCPAHWHLNKLRRDQ